MCRCENEILDECQDKLTVKKGEAENAEIITKSGKKTEMGFIISLNMKLVRHSECPNTNCESSGFCYKCENEDKAYRARKGFEMIGYRLDCVTPFYINIIMILIIYFRIYLLKMTDRTIRFLLLF